MRIKLSDYVAQKLFELGIRHVFMVTGGGAMHLNHSLGKSHQLICTFNHHEQACAMAADSYARLTNKPAVINVTTGPGSTNAITGVHGAWTDSLPMLIISGQVKKETTIRSTGLPLRQYGDQEVDIIPMISSITKYAVMVEEPNEIRYHLEKAFYLATEGRKGPCWLDIPIDVQGAMIDTDELTGFSTPTTNSLQSEERLTKAGAVLDMIKQAKSPVIFAGSGVRLSGGYQEFITFIETLKIPVVSGWNAHDVIWDKHEYFAGKPGSVGDRPGNFVVQNADVIFILGSRLNIRQTSYNWDSFAKNAYKIWLDIDAIEMEKPSINAQMKIHDDIALFLPVINSLNYQRPDKCHDKWLAWTQQLRKKYLVVLESYWQDEKVNPYCFIECLFDSLPEKQCIVSANGTACVVGFQAAKLKKEQRFWTNSGSASMGYDLPAAIGAAVGAPGEDIICLAGDGSIMMNLQELQTIIGNHLPIKIFILNNEGYSSIFQTQKNFFNGEEVGASANSGVNFPSFEKISQAFGFPYVQIAKHESMRRQIQEVLLIQGAVICEVFLNENQPFAPKLSSKQHPDGSISSPSLEDMSPFLTAEELAENIY